MSEKVLVTGGAGFIGSHLCEKLAATGHDVFVVDNFSTGRRENLPEGVELFEGDITVPEVCFKACCDIDIIYHLAARVTIRGSVENFCEDAEVNLMGTLNLLRAAGEQNVRRFILASSMGVYSEALDRKPVSEIHETNPLSPYGISKLSAEKYLFLMGPMLGLEPVALRLFNTYGPRQGYSAYVGVVTIFVTNILKGIPCTVYGNGEQLRDFVHVSDVVDAFVLSGESKEAVGEVINIGTGQGITINYLFKVISNKLNTGVFHCEPSHLAELTCSVADVSKAKKILGYFPKCRFEENIGELLKYFKSVCC